MAAAKKKTAAQARADFKKELAKSAKMPKAGAPVGNRFWEARSKHGRDKLFSNPEILWEGCCEYFKWVEENPLYEAKPFAYEGIVEIEQIAKMRAMTVGSLSLFLGISVSTWYDYAKVEGFSEICIIAEQVVREQKFGGASAGLLNAAIIARDLGLADKRELTGANGQPLQTEATHRLDPDQLRQMIKEASDDV